MTYNGSSLSFTELLSQYSTLLYSARCDIVENALFYSHQTIRHPQELYFEPLNTYWLLLFLHHYSFFIAYKYHRAFWSKAFLMIVIMSIIKGWLRVHGFYMTAMISQVQGKFPCLSCQQLHGVSLHLCQAFTISTRISI